VKAQIARPSAGESLSAETPYRVHGAAWGGTGSIAKVEVSVDGGANWAEATLLGEAIPNAWRFWEWEWKTPEKAGPCRLLARATDSAGQMQPRERVGDYGSYMVNHWLPIEVEIA
nr:Ig-like domain-containing protein [Verrucomicrobiota bacterium]